MSDDGPNLLWSVIFGFVFLMVIALVLVFVYQCMWNEGVAPAFDLNDITYSQALSQLLAVAVIAVVFRVILHK